MLNNLKYCQNVVMSSVECEDSANTYTHLSQHNEEDVMGF